MLVYVFTIKTVPNIYDGKASNVSNLGRYGRCNCVVVECIDDCLCRLRESNDHLTRYITMKYTLLVGEFSHEIQRNTIVSTLW